MLDLHYKFCNEEEEYIKQIESQNLELIKKQHS